MARFSNSVNFVPAAGGTVDFVVSSAVQGFMTPALAGMPTGVYKYRAESTDLSQWEIGEGTYTSGTTTLTRTTVLYNSAGTGTAAGQSGAGSKINFTVAPNVGTVQLVEDTLGIDQANTFSDAQKARALANLGAFCPIGGRITLTSATPVLTGSTTGNGTIFFTPFIGGLVPIFDGTDFLATPFTERSQATSDTTKSPAATAAGNTYDMLFWNDAGTLRCTRSAAWSSSTSRGTGAGTPELVMVGGVLLNAQNVTNGPAAQRGTYVGSIRTRAADGLVDWIPSGAASGGVALSFAVWNKYNRLDFKGMNEDTFTSATISVGTAQLNASNNNRVNFLSGLAEDCYSVEVLSYCVPGTGQAGVGLGLDSTSSNSGFGNVAFATGGGVTAGFNVKSSLAAMSFGYHFVQGLQTAFTSTASIYGSGIGLGIKTGIIFQGRF